MTNRQTYAMCVFNSCGALTTKSLRSLGVHPKTISSLSAMGLIRRGSLRSSIPYWEPVRTRGGQG